MVAARFRAARRAGTPFWLWPDLAPATWRAALHELERAVTALLAGGGPVELDAAVTPRALGVAAYTSGLGPWLGGELERGRLGAAAPQGDVLALHLRHARLRAVRLDAALNRVLDALCGAGVPVTVLKGAHTARCYFSEPGLRPMSDIDLLVPADALAAAGAALTRAGLAEDGAARQQRPYRAEWRPVGAARQPRSLELSHAKDPWCIDLHGSPDIDFDGVRTVRFAAVVDRHSRPAPWRDDVAVLAQPLLAAQLAVHASHGLHSLTLIRLLELVQVLRADVCTDGARAALVALLHELGAARFAYPALLMASRLAPDTVPGELLAAAAAAAPPRMRAWLATERPAGMQRPGTLALRDRFIWSAGAVEHVRRALYMLWPGGGLTMRRVARIYGARVWRLLRLRVAWRG